MYMCEWHRFFLLNEQFFDSFSPACYTETNENVINKTENWQFIRPYFWCLMSQFCVVYWCKRVADRFLEWNFIGCDFRAYIEKPLEILLNFYASYIYLHFIPSINVNVVVNL